MKKNTKIIFGIIFLIILIISFICGYFYAWFTDSRAYFDFLTYDYYKIECYYNDDYKRYLSIRYYHEEEGQKMLEKGDFISIEKDLESLTNNINHFFDNNQNGEKYEFNYDSITSDDFYKISIYEECTWLNYYDSKDNILYVFEFPSEDKVIQ